MSVHTHAHTQACLSRLLECADNQRHHTAGSRPRGVQAPRDCQQQQQKQQLARKAHLGHAKALTQDACRSPAQPALASSAHCAGSSSGSASSSRRGRRSHLCHAQSRALVTSSDSAAGASTAAAAESRPLQSHAAVASDHTISSSGSSSSDETAGGRQRQRQVRVGWWTVQGQREEMEDDVVVRQGVARGFTYAAVFDGHMGFSSVTFLKDELFKECMAELRGGELLEAEELEEAEEALERAFVQTDERLLQWLQEEHIEQRESGSTATAVFARPDRVFVAHIGDSRAVLSLGEDVEELCEDHRPRSSTNMGMSEKERIQEAGGWVKYGRVCGVLAVSRAFGNIRFKTLRHEMLQEGLRKGRWTKGFINKLNLEGEWVTAMPDVYAADLTDDAEFLLIASDGLWDCVRSTEAVRFVQKRMAVHGDVQRASEELTEFALEERQSDDNISVVIIAFH